MSSQADIAAARDAVVRVRARMSDTVSRIEERVASRVDAVKDRLDAGRLVGDHPWSALAVALGAGVLLAASGADRKAASAVADGSRQAAASGAQRAGRAASSTVSAARQAPGRTRSAIVGVADALATRLALSLIGALAEQ